jgi:hypothetical protein
MLTCLVFVSPELRLSHPSLLCALHELCVKTNRRPCPDLSVTRRVLHSRPLVPPAKAQLLYFDTLVNSFVILAKLCPLFSSNSELLLQNTRGGGCSLFSQDTEHRPRIASPRPTHKTAQLYSFQQTAANSLHTPGVHPYQRTKDSSDG